MALNEEYFHKIAAKVVEEGEPGDLAKFVLSGNEALAAAQRYFYNLEAGEKKTLIMEDDIWFLSYYKKKYTGLALFKIFASSFIPFVEDLIITNIHLKDYSFLKDIKHLKRLILKFKDQEHLKVLPALSSLKSVDLLYLTIKGLNLQLLSSLAFSFGYLEARNFTFEVDPQCSKVFQTPNVRLLGDEELQNDFVFTRENYQNYAAIFPNAARLQFVFFVKIVDDVSDLLKVSNASHAAEVNVNNRNVKFHYYFYDYSGFPKSKVLTMVQNNENWRDFGCPYKYALHRNLTVTCEFPLVAEEIGKRIAQSTLRRIPEGSDGHPEDYYRLIINYEGKHEAEFKVFKTTSIKELIKAYGKITGLGHKRFGIKVRGRWISNGTVAEKFQDGGTIVFGFRR